MSTTKFLNTTSYCGPGQLLPIYNNSKGRFLYIPLMSPAKKPVLTNALRSVSGDDASRNVQTTPTPICRDSTHSLRYDSSRSNMWHLPLVYTLCSVLERVISIKGQ